MALISEDEEGLPLGEPPIFPSEPTGCLARTSRHQQECKNTDNERHQALFASLVKVRTAITRGDLV